MNTSPMASESHNTPRDTFLYLLSLVTLIASAVSFGILVFQLINVKFPDPLQNGGYYISPSGYYSMIRSALAALVVLFPVFFWVSRVIHKDVVAHPEKREMKVRKWLLYLTVFAASLVVIGDLITLIYNFLQGELTTPFILKVLTVLFIAGSSLWYYLSELQSRQYPRAVFQGIIIAAVAAAVVYGFTVAGSPQHQRLVRFDEQKITHLQTIQNQLVYSYWQQKGSLPTSLEQLEDPISGFMVPRDPQSGQAYEYTATGARTFRLCATFNETSVDSNKSSSPQVLPAGVGINDTWQHGADHACFDRTIDPALYPVKPVSSR